jgi:hypothetical protein
VFEDVALLDHDDPHPPPPCGFCSGTGERVTGMASDGSLISELCTECGGDGIFGSDVP